jgi:hypothetical protein
VVFSSGEDPVLYLRNPEGHDKLSRRNMLDHLAKLNDLAFEDFGDPEIQNKVQQYEMSYRMQTAVPELTDISKEPDHIVKDVWGGLPCTRNLCSQLLTCT